jgi:hypothetical protein
MAKQTTHPEPRTETEKEALLKSLRTHGQVLESEDPGAPLGPGQTHVFLTKPGEPGGTLIEKRKSLFKR